MRQFDACSLCLQRAREPLACEEGHLFCKECVYTDLLLQKKDIQRQKEKLESLKREAEEERARAKEAARERVLLEFEKGQLGLASTPSVPGTTSGIGSTGSKGTKRKFAFDSSTVENLAQEAEEAALRQIEREQAEALRHKLPDFWLPSLTPTYTSSGPPSSLKDVKLQTTCRGGNPVHPIVLKKLLAVKFSFHSSNASRSTEVTPTVGEGPSSTKDEQQDPMCPCCKKIFSNSLLMFLMKPCSHVVCKTCTDTLVRPAGQCIVCDSTLGSKDIIELRREGTGFAGGGMAETSKAGTAFQG